MFTETHPVALVTGASRGIGQEVAVGLALAGYDIAAIGRDEEALAQTERKIRERSDQRIASYVCDIGTDELAATTNRISADFGPISLLVNNAGTAGSTDSFLDGNLRTWWNVFETNVKGTAQVTWHVGRVMRERGCGRIINMNSMQASKVSGIGLAYGASKAALMRFTDALNEELRTSGIAVFDVSPGLVRTAMTSDRPDLDALPPEAWNTPEETSALVVKLGSGKWDMLQGRVVRVSDDLEALSAEVRRDPDSRVLRVKRPAA